MSSNINSNTKFCLSSHYNADNSYLLVNGKEIPKFEAQNKNVNFPTQLCLGSISNGFSSREIYLNKVYNFQSITIVEKSVIISINKYLMTNNNIK